MANRKNVLKGEIVAVSWYEAKETGIPAYVILAEATSNEKDGRVLVPDLVVLYRRTGSNSWLPPLVWRDVIGGSQYEFEGTVPPFRLCLEPVDGQVIVGKVEVLAFLQATKGFESHEASLRCVWSR